MPEYLVHKAVNVDKVHSALRKIIERPGYLESNYIAQSKYDGCNMIVEVIAEGDTFYAKAQSRTGEVVKSVDHILVSLCSLPGIREGVYLGEAWCPDADFASISGWFRRQQADEETCRLQFVVFDFLTSQEFSDGQSNLGYAGRVSRIPAILASIKQEHAPVWLASSWGYISETWSAETTAQDVCNKLVAQGGYDGLILRDPVGKWKAGSGTTGEIIKLKQRHTLDLRVVGWEQGKGKHAERMGAIRVAYGEFEFSIGTGFTDEMRELPAEYWIGKIVEVEYMGDSSKGLVREPRFKGVRFDKEEADA